jgi:uncharacterized repeat protein (TIGR03803 family)/YD repeat-containing protein
MANPLFAQSVQYAYDKDGRLTQVTRDDGIVDAYQYDVANNLIKNTGVADNTVVPFSPTDYTPKSAIVGATITITGTGFSNPTVSFNGTPATVTSSTDTSLTVAVPTGATSGPLPVTVGGQTLTAGAFNVLVNPNAFSVADFTPKSAAIGDSFTLTGTGFTNPTVTINGTPATITASTATSITVTVPPGATSGPVIVMVGGQSQTVGTFTVTTPVPSFTVTDFTPRSAPVGSAVTISGTGFTNPTVAFNGIAAPVTNITDTGITATVPVGATSGPLTVTVGNQTQEAGTFTVASAVAPVLTAYSLPVAQAGDTITLAGTNFDISSPNANLVKVGGIRANVTAVNATQLTFIVPPFSTINNPPGTPGTAQTVTVQTAAGTTTALKPLYLVPRIIFNKPFSPTATAFGDFTAPGDNGLLLAQSGQYNVPVQGFNINGSGRLNLFVFDADNKLIQTIQAPIAPFGPLINGNFQATTGAFTLPSGGPYVIQTVFETDSNLGFQATGSINFGLLPFLVTGFTPQSGFPGDSITITGSGFVNPIVAFNSIPAIITASSPTNITATVPSGVSTGLLTVTDQGSKQAVGTFIVPVSIANFTPQYGLEGTNVSITGTGFINPSVLFVNESSELSQATVAASSPTSITVIVPSRARSGRIIISDQGLTFFTNRDFIVSSFIVTGFTPQSGLPGDSITITGSGFVNPRVTFNGVPGIITAMSPTSLTVTVPRSEGTLVVTDQGYTQVVGTFSGLPTLITGFTPQFGILGTSVTITGSNFVNPTVAFNGIPATVTNSTLNSITAIVPPGNASGFLTIRDQGSTKNVGVFTAASFVAERFTPLFGSSGESMTITGNGFDNPTVAFNGIQAIVTAKTATSLTVTVPNGLSDGAQNITVTEGGITQSLGYYQVRNSTSIASITPVEGRPGDSITITGTGFRGQGHPFDPPRVAFNGIDAQVKAFTSTSITAVVPNRLNAGIQTVTVQNPGEAILNAGFYTVTANPIDPTPVNQITIDTLHSFNGIDGANPFAHLLPVSDGSFYGSSYTGGANDKGTIFRITQNGTVTVIHSFNGVDGLKPNELIQASDGNFYGTTKEGGVNGKGTIFRLAANGTFNTLYSFNGIDGDSPQAGLLQANDGNLYGTTFSGGSNGQGVLFRLGLDGTLATVYDFGSPDGFDPLDPLFADAENPSGQLIQGNDGALYGTTEGGGDLSSPGTIYSMTLTGTETVLDFNFLGDIPVGGFIQTRDGNFYFTVSSTNGGTIYRITPGGSVGYSFSYGQGGSPAGSLFEGSDGNIYGTTSTGGSQDLGTIFRYQPDASFGSFDSLYSFNGQNGSHPFGGLIQGSDGSLYGSAFDGGTNNQGTLFKLTLAVPPSITSFSPASAPVGSAVLIKGTNFTGVTGVSFNGILAGFTIYNSSDTEITAIVPAGATTGLITVSTPNGKATSLTPLTVTP